MKNEILLLYCVQKHQISRKQITKFTQTLNKADPKNNIQGEVKATKQKQ